MSPEDNERPSTAAGEDERGLRRARKKAAEVGSALNRDPRLVRAVKLLRELLPGDSRFGDPLSTAGDADAELIGRGLSRVSSEHPRVLREAGLSALQVWQALAQAGSGGGKPEELTILFTDLAGFSDWALDAGDEATLEMLREVALAIEPPVAKHRGRVVKRLGDGMMAVFGDAGDGFAAVLEAQEDLREVGAEGYEPRLRAGLHHGEARLLGGDYFGVDVNIAARLAEHAGPGELLVSEAALERIDDERAAARKKRLFRGKGVPKDVAVYSVSGR